MEKCPAESLYRPENSYSNSLSSSSSTQHRFAVLQRTVHTLRASFVPSSSRWLGKSLPASRLQIMWYLLYNQWWPRLLPSLALYCFIRGRRWVRAHWGLWFRLSSIDNRCLRGDITVLAKILFHVSYFVICIAVGSRSFLDVKNVFLFCVL